MLFGVVIYIVSLFLLLYFRVVVVVRSNHVAVLFIVLEIFAGDITYGVSELFTLFTLKR